MVFAAIITVLAAAQLVSAHFGIIYPEWRANTLMANSSYSQWNYPCAGVPGGSSNGSRTEWPLTGGSVKLDLKHDWTYVVVNLGIGENVTNFNYTLTPLTNLTGTGEYCFKTLSLPAEVSVEDGTEASIQVVNVGHSGSALYNCADIVFRSSASALADEECSTEGFEAATVEEQTAAGSIVALDTTVLTVVLGMAVMFVFGIAM